MGKTENRLSLFTWLFSKTVHNQDCSFSTSQSNVNVSLLTLHHEDLRTGNMSHFNKCNSRRTKPFFQDPYLNSDKYTKVTSGNFPCISYLA